MAADGDHPLTCHPYGDQAQHDKDSASIAAPEVDHSIDAPQANSSPEGPQVSM